MPFVYILSTESGKYYIGSTDNLEQRLLHHGHGSTPSTKRMGKPKLIFKQEYASLKAARYVESRLKRLKRRDYLDRIISEGLIKILPP